MGNKTSSLNIHKEIYEEFKCVMWKKSLIGEAVNFTYIYISHSINQIYLI